MISPVSIIPSICAVALALSTPCPAQNAQTASYKEFLEELKKVEKEGSIDFSAAMQIVLNATQDEFAGIQWMEKAAQGGNAAAMQYIGDIMLSKLLPEEVNSAKAKEAFQLVKKAADAGYSPAAVNVCLCMERGIGTKKDPNGKTAYIFEACKGGNFVARFKWLELSGRLKTAEDFERNEVKQEIERGNYYLSYYFVRFATSPKHQEELLKKAAKQGSTDALYALANHYLKSDPARSFTLLKEAAKLRHPGAMGMLGVCVLKPESLADFAEKAEVPHMPETGLHLLKLSSMLQSRESHEQLANCYAYGLYGIKQDYQRAFRHLEEATRLSSFRGLIGQCVLSMAGLGVERDIPRALGVLEMLSNEGNPFAATALGYCYYKGYTGKVDLKEADSWLQTAASLGSSMAYVYLAYIIESENPGSVEKKNLAQSFIDMAALDMGKNAELLMQELRDKGKWELPF